MTKTKLQGSKQLEKNTLMIKNITHMMAQRILENDILFQRFIKINKGFVDECVLKTIGRNKKHPDYDDLYQASSLGLFKSLNKFSEGRSSFSTFAFKVMQNEVRQELKKLNKQKNVEKIDKTKGGGYIHHEMPMEWLQTKDDTNQETGTYREHLFKETARIKQLRNFDEDILNHIILEERMKNFSDLEKEIYDLHYIEGLSIKKVAIKLNKTYGNIKEMFYRRMKPKFDKIHEEIITS